jgi:hypothetical protein
VKLGKSNTVGGGDIRKGCRRVNMVEMLGSGKMRPVETVPGVGRGRIKVSCNTSSQMLEG